MSWQDQAIGCGWKSPEQVQELRNEIKNLRHALRGYSCHCDGPCPRPLGSVCGKTASKALSSDIGEKPHDKT